MAEKFFGELPRYTSIEESTYFHYAIIENDTIMVKMVDVYGFSNMKKILEQEISKNIIVLRSCEKIEKVYNFNNASDSIIDCFDYPEEEGLNKYAGLFTGTHSYICDCTGQFDI